jgi:Zn-finger nucleic acid-binding protein
MICPKCHVSLNIDPNPKGAIWICSLCSGVAVNVAVLRNLLQQGLIKNLWRRFLTKSLLTNRQCPSCRNPLRVFKFPVNNNNEISLDLCKICQIVWFDKGELDMLSKAETFDKHIPAEVKQKLAVYRIELEKQLIDELENDTIRLHNWVDLTIMVFRVIISLLFHL